MPRDDRVHLALGQQNGLTAIVLALALQPYLPSAVGIIAMAVLTVNALHLVTNGAWDLMGQDGHRKAHRGPNSRKLPNPQPVGSAVAGSAKIPFS